MKTMLILPAGMREQIFGHLISDTTREQMGILLAGTAKKRGNLRLLGRRYIPLLPKDFEEQGQADLRVKKNITRQIASICRDEKLSQIDFHSHPFDNSKNVSFSPIDDHYERQTHFYFRRKLPNSFYASVVVGQDSFNARIWLPKKQNHMSIDAIRFLDHPLETVNLNDNNKTNGSKGKPEIYNRQILAFGKEGQEIISSLNVAIVGAGGIGSILTEKLTRLGVGRFLIIDDDCCDFSNLNRLMGMTYKDAQKNRPKVRVMRRLIKSINPFAKTKMLKTSVFDCKTLENLRFCDIIIAATDNHATRLVLQHLSAQYLIPLIHTGTNIEVNGKGDITDISAEFAVFRPGTWCLFCAGIIDRQTAAWELAHTREQQRWLNHGYVRGDDIPSPAVCHTNGVIANLAIAEIHNMVSPFRPLQDYVVFDQMKNEIFNVIVKQNNQCSCCHNEALLGLGDIEPLPDYARDHRNLPILPKP